MPRAAVVPDGVPRGNFDRLTHPLLKETRMSTNTATQTLQPPAGLILENTQDPDKPLFCLFTEEWIQLQTFIVQALQLPVTTSNFEAKYGKFKDEGEVKSVVAAMKAIQGLSTSFGDPVALFNELGTDPHIL